MISTISTNRSREWHNFEYSCNAVVYATLFVSIEFSTFFHPLMITPLYKQSFNLTKATGEKFFADPLHDGKLQTYILQVIISREKDSKVE